MNPANKKSDESHSDFQAGIGSAGHATLDKEQFISATRDTLVDTVDSLQVSDGGVNVASIVHGLPTKIHDILGNAVSKWVGNTTCILAYPFNSAARLCCNAWA